MSKLGAMARTSFWTRRTPVRPEPTPDPEWSSPPPYEEAGGWFEGDDVARQLTTFHGSIR